MHGLRDIILVARWLTDELGPGGHATVQSRADDLVGAGASEDAVFWRRVAMAMRALDPSSVTALEGR